MPARNGGYLRILKIGFRQGDNAPMALVELVDRPETGRRAGKGRSGRRITFIASRHARKATHSMRGHFVWVRRFWQCVRLPQTDAPAGAE